MLTPIFPINTIPYAAYATFVLKIFERKIDGNNKFMMLKGLSRLDFLQRILSDLQDFGNGKLIKICTKELWL